MVGMLQRLEQCAARGAEGLSPEGRKALAAGLSALGREEGGFAGLDGRSDPYYTFFAWLCLRALGAAYDGRRLCAYLAAQRPGAPLVDSCCAELVLLGEGRSSRARSCLRFAQAWRRSTKGGYALFLLGLWLEALGPFALPRPLARLAVRRFARRESPHVPTPTLAAWVALAASTGVANEALARALASRRCAKGGFASAAGVRPDLLATAVARFACALTPGFEPAQPNAGDLAFVEACWCEDGLFGATPAAACGDAEHTFYGLLALGTCRGEPVQSDFSQRL